MFNKIRIDSSFYQNTTFYNYVTFLDTGYIKVIP